MFYYDLLIIIYTVRIKYEHEDNCFDRVLPGYRQDVNIPDARIVVEQGIGHMPDIEMRHEATSEGLGACTVRIMAYMKYPKPYKPDGRLLTNEEMDNIAKNIIKTYFKYRCHDAGLVVYHEARYIHNISKKSAQSIKYRLEKRIKEYEDLFYSTPHATLEYRKPSENDESFAIFDFIHANFKMSLDDIRLLTK